MRKIMRAHLLYVYILIVLSLGVLVSCDNNDDANSTSVSAQLTAHPWRLLDVTVSGVDKTDLYSDLTLNFAEGTYTAQPPNPIWLTGGSWILTSDTTLLITPHGQEPLMVTIISVSDIMLKVSLEWDATTLDAGRTGSIEGPHIFEFAK